MKHDFFKRKTPFSLIYRVRGTFYFKGGNWMFLNKRMPAKKLLYYTALAARRELDALEMYNLRTIKKGYEGECLYDKVFDEIGHENIYIIRDVYLKIGGSVTQYDSIVITENRLVMNEIKNLSGDYRFDNNKWMKDSVELTDNVYAQLSRGKGKLLKLRNENQLNIEIEGKMIFLNDDFRLTSENDYIWDETVLLNQMRSYFRKFREEYVGNKANNIVRIIKNQIVEDPYFKESADIFHLHRGLYCGQCGSFALTKGRFQLSCNNCGSIESSETHVFRAMHDYQILFPNQPMTRTNLLYFIDHQISRTAVYGVMMKHCNAIKGEKKMIYQLKSKDADEVLMHIKKTQRYKDKIIST